MLVVAEVAAVDALEAALVAWVAAPVISLAVGPVVKAVPSESYMILLVEKHYRD